MLGKTDLFKNFLLISGLYLYPHHLLSRLVGWLCRIENAAFKNKLIRYFGKRYRTNTKEAVSRNLNHYPNLNSFYTRALKPEARPINHLHGGITCPADGTVSQVGKISSGEIVQVKGGAFSVIALLGGKNKYTDPYVDGVFVTIVLSLGDYHRVHMPFDATLLETVHVPGRLFSVNRTTQALIPGLYARNERVVCFFESEAGPMALVLVGSVFASSIETVWEGVITPPTDTEIKRWNYPYNSPTGKKGEEMGRFNLGSTVILLFAGAKVRWEEDLLQETSVKMGRLIGKALV